MSDRIVVKVGGSLYDWPELGPRLRHYLSHLGSRHILIVPGGGPMADTIRRLDRMHHLDEEDSHWLALRALSVNAGFLKTLLPDARILSGIERDKPEYWDGLTIVDAYSFALADESRPGRLPHVWDAGSDCVAARVVTVCQASRLILLKSVTIPASMDWQSAAEDGLVDRWFAKVLEQATPRFQVTAINFRSYPLGTQ